MQTISTLLRRLQRGASASIAPTRQTHLLRGFSIVSFILISAIALGLGAVSTRYLVIESLERDALLSAQFIQTIAKGEIRHHGLTGMRMGDVLAATQYGMLSEEMTLNRHRARSEFLDHLSHLPDSLLISIYSPLRTVMWSTNAQMIGKKFLNDEVLEAAFSSRDRVSTRYSNADERRPEQQFLHPPKMFFIESYIPLVDDLGNTLAVVEIYKEPVDLIERLNRGHWIIWLSTAVGGLLLYLGLYWIVRRASNQLASQEAQLVANKTYVGLVEMSTAVAHSLRNPLACIRSSAELANSMEGQPAKKNIDDIVSQVDRMAQWVHELLLCLRPIRGEAELVEPMPVVQATLASFSAQLIQSGIQVEVENVPVPRIISNPLLLSQILNSVIANAIEAMPEGGKLTLQASVDEAQQWLHLTIADTGEGSARQQEMMAFKSFYTTRQGRLGIGLIMVKQIMESFGGEAGLTYHEQKGTSVHLSFRVVERRAKALS
ncbi:HAMP domain-containing sensor histidine kinase [Pseudomonas sp. C2B4]|uniref:sensor histidine kinase n=1 Tax=Pseudomonas sp. C2B4 TaxID=2735270 RepID=UPI001586AFE7|nr:HAMP domain-containing sensor histidine kinase [Pseudomonas sp. C2B4]NUU39285.1 HAMP domain-containing histidine kinase [Pseudomonas sp. C2B4]